MAEDKSIEGFATAGALADTDLFPLKQSGAELVAATLAVMKSFLRQGGRPSVAVSGTSKNLAASDVGTTQNCSNASTQTITFIANIAPVDAEIEFIQMGDGQVVFAAGGGVTLQPSTTLKISAKYKAAVAKQLSLNNWVIIGSLSA
jgi:hypothetical protein